MFGCRGKWVCKIVGLICLISGILFAQSELNIYLTADLNGVLKSDSPQRGGLLQVYTAMTEHLEDDSLNWLMLDAGNAISGHYHARFDQGRTMFSEMTRGYSALTPGNLDLHYGLPHLLELQREAILPSVLSANLREPGGGIAMAPYQIFNRSGISVAVLGLTSPTLEDRILSENMAGFQVQDTGKNFGSFLDQAKTFSDLQIVLTRFDLESSIKLANKFPEIDLLLRRFEPNTPPVVHITNAAGESCVIVMAERSARAIRHIRGIQKEQEGQWEFLRQADIPVAGVTLNAVDSLRFLEIDADYVRYAADRWQGLTADSIMGDFGEEPSGTLLQYQLYQMLKSTRSEIAILNRGFLRNRSGRTLTSELRLRDLDAINWTGNQLITVRLKGALLKKILEKGETRGERSSRRLFSLAISRRDGDLFSIHGNGILDNETYAVVTSRYLAEGGDGYEEFKQGFRLRSYFRGDTRLHGTTDGDGRRIVLGDELIDWIRGEDRPAKFGELSNWLADNSFMKRPLWLVNLRQIDFLFRQVNVSNNEAFSAAPDARINATSEDFFSLGFDGDIGLLRRSERLIWENRMLLRHARTRQGGEGLEETNDYLEFRSVFDTPLPKHFLRLKRKFNLFGSGRLETEITPTVDENGVKNPRRQDAYLTVGLSYLGRWVDELRFGYYGKWDLNDGSRDSGIEFGGRYGKSFGRLTFGSTLKSRYNITFSAMAAGDEKASIELNNFLAIKLTGNLAIKPRVDLFAWRDAVLEETATNIQYIVGLSYAKIWKPQYLRWR